MYTPPCYVISRYLPMGDNHWSKRVNYGFHIFFNRRVINNIFDSGFPNIIMGVVIMFSDESKCRCYLEKFSRSFSNKISHMNKGIQ